MSIIPVTREILKAGDDYIKALELKMNQYIHLHCANCGHEMHIPKSRFDGTSCSKCGGAPLKGIG